MTKEQAQQIILNELEFWTGEYVAEYVEESIRGNDDEELLQALDLVGTNFNWSCEFKVEAD